MDESDRIISPTFPALMLTAAEVFAFGFHSSNLSTLS
jgi:hypothetical protein